MSLTYTLAYSPKTACTQPGDINFICSDKKLHIRLRDYSKYQVIAGFEQKLTYLVTYLVNFSSIISAYDLEMSRENAIKAFIESDEAKRICDCVQKTLNQKVRGIKIFHNYRKHDVNILGEVSPEAFPVFKGAKNEIAGSFGYFLDLFRLNLNEYLFNDRFKIIIHEDKDTSEKVNKKFINKQLRKQSRITADYEQLW